MASEKEIDSFKSVYFILKIEMYVIFMSLWLQEVKLSVNPWLNRSETYVLGNISNDFFFFKSV